MIAELLGKSDGYCKGLGGSMHIADKTKGNLGANGVVGAGIPIGVGAALGSSIKNDGKVTVTFASDGAANNGVFSEGLNLAAAWGLPYILVVENNQFAVSTPISQSTKESELFKRGQSLGVESIRIDGNNVFEVMEQAKIAVQKCREGNGPYLIEAVTFRHGGHHVNDPGAYMPKDQLEHYMSKDPINQCKDYLLNKSGFSEDEITEIERSVMNEVAEGIEFAKNSPEMGTEEFLDFVEKY